MESSGIVVGTSEITHGYVDISSKDSLTITTSQATDVLDSRVMFELFSSRKHITGIWTESLWISSAGVSSFNCTSRGSPAMVDTGAKNSAERMVNIILMSMTFFKCTSSKWLPGHNRVIFHYKSQKRTSLTSRMLRKKAYRGRHCSTHFNTLSVRPFLDNVCM